jgi:hypothetical protein
MKNYMEKAVIRDMTICKVVVLIPTTRKEVGMILENVMRRLRHRIILNNMKREINKLIYVDMTMQNMVMV